MHSPKAATESHFLCSTHTRVHTNACAHTHAQLGNRCTLTHAPALNPPRPTSPDTHTPVWIPIRSCTGWLSGMRICTRGHVAMQQTRVSFLWLHWAASRCLLQIHCCATAGSCLQGYRHQAGKGKQPNIVHSTSRRAREVDVSTYHV